MQTARLFTNGRSQAVRLPKEYRFKGSDVYIKRLGTVIMLIPTDDPWRPFMESLDMFTDDFMAGRNQPAGQQKRKGL